MQNLFNSSGYLRCLLLILISAGAIPVCGQIETPATPVIALEPCRLESLGGFSKAKALCGTLTVPLNPAAPDGKSIDLFVAKIPALSRQPAPSAFTYIAGGPGQSSTQAYVSLRGAFSRIRHDHDIILVDQRGTGKSSPQHCQDFDDTESMDPDDWSAEDTRDYAAECLEALSDDARFYTTSLAVQDLDAVRAAMGYAQLDLYGVSYGTRVAQHYLRRFPEHTRTVIIDGVAPVNVALGPGLAIDAQRALDMVFDRCAADSVCTFNFGNLREKFKTLRTRLKRQPQAIRLPDPISGKMTDTQLGYGEFLIAIRLMSYSPEMVSLLPLMLDSAAKGYYQPLAAQALLSIESLSTMLAYGMHNTVVCAEDVPFYQEHGIDKSALAASYMGDISYKALIETCKVWPAGPVDDDFKTTFKSDTPVLVLSGEADPVTPPVYGEMAAQYLGNTRHIVVAGQGHGQAHIGCMPKVMADFVISGNFSDPENTCWKAQQAAPFFSSFSGPEP